MALPLATAGRRSNLGYANALWPMENYWKIKKDKKMLYRRKRSGAVGSCALFIAGNAIGAGVLGLPIAMGSSGFFPSAVACIILYFLMLGSGIAFTHFFCDPPSTDLPVFFRRHLGKVGFGIFSIAYFTLFFCLLVAYWSGMRSLFAAYHLAGPFTVGSVGLILFLLRRRTSQMGKLINLLVFGLFISFFGLIFATLFYGGDGAAQGANWHCIYGGLPIIFCSYGFQAAIPIVCHRLQFHRRDIRHALIWGTFFPLIFNLAILFIAYRVLSFDALAEGAARGLPVFLLFREYLCAPVFSILGESFSFFAIGSSLLGVTMTFSHALDDTAQKSRRCGGNLTVFFAVLLPLLIAVYWPNLFISTLEMAGGIFLNLIGGILPMVVLLKYRGIRWQSSVYLAGFLCILAVEIGHICGIFQR
ncbi:MAG: hypothetical protein LBI69_05065 [Puniceicoccales bacterium]|nr:hypothetical protein [Puniceicoccales bacterium]